MERQLTFLDGKSQHCKDVNSKQPLSKAQQNYMKLDQLNLNSSGREKVRIVRQLLGEEKYNEERPTLPA